MGWVYLLEGAKQEVCTELCGGECCWNDLLGRPMRWEDNINMNFREVICVHVSSVKYRSQFLESLLLVLQCKTPKNSFKLHAIERRIG
jgi:hypothetical protein